MLNNFLTLEGKYDDYYLKEKTKAKGRDRKFEEITNQQQF